MHFEYTTIYSVTIATHVVSDDPVFFHIMLPMKFSLPKTESINTFKYGISLSSVCTKTAPSSLKKERDISSLFFIKVNHAEWLNLSLYSKLSLPVLYGGSMYIILTLPAYLLLMLCNAIRLFPLITKLSSSDREDCSPPPERSYFLTFLKTLGSNNSSISDLAKTSFKNCSLASPASSTFSLLIPAFKTVSLNGKSSTTSVDSSMNLPPEVKPILFEYLV